MNKPGKVWWITGVPGAGKTTLSREFARQLIKQGKRCIVLDGDDLREILGVRSCAYDVESRKQLAFTYSRLCKNLSDQGFDVIIGTVSLFEVVHEWNRDNICCYNEVLVTASQDTLQERDQKGLYSASSSGEKINLPGKDLAVDLPSNPDYVIQNNGSESPAILVRPLVEAYKLKF